MLQGIAFYLLAATAVVSGLLVVTARNPVHSVLFLILAFFNAAGLFVLLGAEFLAMTLVIVYVGAVAVLFLFVVMMLDVDFAALKGELVRYMPLGLLMGVIMLLMLGMGFGAWQSADGAQADAQLRLAIRHAMEAGASQREIAEVIFQMSMFGGVPAMTRALEIARSVFDEKSGENT